MFNLISLIPGVKEIKKIKSRINYDYLRIIEEIPVLIKLALKHQIEKQDAKFEENSEKILIINTCLIGDFMATLHALRTFIKKHKAKIDLVVSPPVKTLAERIKGVNKVFIAKSSCNRNIENCKKCIQNFDEYDSVLVMKMGKDAYELLKNIEFRGLKSHLKHYVKYMWYWTNNATKKKKLKQWRDVNFEIVGEKSKKYVKFNDIFDFKKFDYNNIKRLDEMRTKKKKILIHTGSGWPVTFWDNNKWAELLKRINNLGDYCFIFIGGSNDEKSAFNKIQKKLDFKIYSLIGKADIKDLMLVMKLSDYFIGIDSGPRNMAHIANLRSVSLLGPGPKVFMPLDKRDIVIDKSKCKCTKFFCPYKTTCMDKIEVDEVYKGFKKLFN